MGSALRRFEPPRDQLQESMINCDNQLEACRLELIQILQKIEDPNQMVVHRKSKSLFL